MDTLGGEESGPPSAVTKFFVSISQVLKIFFKKNVISFSGE